MKSKLSLIQILILAICAGVANAAESEKAMRVMQPVIDVPATEFFDGSRRVTLDRYRGQFLVVNFWATWCAPCREEMPAFVRLQSRWGTRGVQFVGIANEDPAKVHRFGRELGINYPLWTGGDEVGELSRRLGNRLGVLPHTALIGSKGEVLDVRVGPYTEAQMEERLTAFAPKTP